MQIVSCALALLAGVVGAGFASGREVSRFFAGHGKAAPAAVLLASGSLLFFFLRLCEKMERLGAKVDYDIPHRINDGYGINIELIQKAWEADVDTILTCDNGISAREQIAYARSLGMTVIVTDHHDVPFLETAEGRIEQIPPADAVINPKQSACQYPFKGLCGAAVATTLIPAKGRARSPMLKPSRKRQLFSLEIQNPLPFLICGT